MMNFLQDSVIPASEHSGELTATVITMITAVAICYVKVIGAMFRLGDRASAIGACLVSCAALSAWSVTEYHFSTGGVFPLFEAYGLILTATYGVVQTISHAATQNALATVTAGRMGAESVKPDSTRKLDGGSQ